MILLEPGPFILILGSIIAGLVLYFTPNFLICVFLFMFDGRSAGSLVHYLFVLIGLVVSGAIFVYASSKTSGPYWLGAMGYLIGYALGRLITRARND